MLIYCFKIYCFGKKEEKREFMNDNYFAIVGQRAYNHVRSLNVFWSISEWIVGRKMKLDW